MIDGHIAFGETHLFVGPGYVVSVRHGASTSYAAVRERCEAGPAALSDGEDYILYAILDFIVDNYMPVIEAIQSEVEEIEDGVRRADGPSLCVGFITFAAICCGCATRRCRWSKSAGGSSIPKGGDRHLDVAAVPRRLRSRAALSGGIRSLARSAGVRVRGQADDRSARQTVITRRLAAGAAILQSDRDRRHLRDELRAHAGAEMAYGYPFVLGVIAAVCGWIYWRFHRNNWL